MHTSCSPFASAVVLPFLLGLLFLPLAIHVFLNPPNVRTRRFVLGVLSVLLVTGMVAPRQTAASETSRNVESDPARFTADSSDVAVNLRPYPLALWGPRAGLGLGAGLVVHNLGLDGSQWLLTAAPAWHEQVGTFSFATSDPRTAHNYALLDARLAHTDRLWFYGLGPRSSNDSQVALTATSFDARLRFGRSFARQRVLVQPHVALKQHHVTSVEDVDDGAVDALDPASQANLRAVSGDGDVLGDRQLGIRYGLDVAYDTRDRRHGATRGVLLQATVLRHAGLLDGDLRFDQLTLDGYGFVPLGRRHRLVLRLRLDATRDRGDAPIPFFLLPSLDGQLVPGFARHRFVGSESLVSSLVYRFPLVQISDLFVLEGHAGVHAATVYDDLADQFTLDVSFDETLDAERDAVPLRPAASTGVRLGPIFRDETYVDVAVGVSPEGVSGVRLSLVRSLTSVRPPHHTR